MDQKVDLTYLINQRKLITNDELANILPLVQYNTYYELFYKKKCSKFIKIIRETNGLKINI